MRHSDIETTSKYVNLDMDDVIKAHQEHSPLKKLFGPELSPGQSGSSVVQSIASILQKARDALDELATQIPSQDNLNGSGKLLDKFRRAHNWVVIAHGHLLQLIALQLEDLSLVSFYHSHDAEGRIVLSDQLVDHSKWEEKFLQQLIEEADAELESIERSREAKEGC